MAVTNDGNIVSDSRRTKECVTRKLLLFNNLERLKTDEVIILEELIRKIELILIEEGQHDLRFKLGDIIKYNPHEIVEILRKHAGELLIQIVV